MSDKIRPIVQANLLLDAVKNNTNKVVLALMHPDDLKNISSEKIEQFKIALKITSILPSDKVEKGWMFIDNKPIKN